MSGLRTAFRRLVAHKPLVLLAVVVLGPSVATACLCLETLKLFVRDAVPFSQQSRLVAISVSSDTLKVRDIHASLPDVFDYRDRSDIFSSVAAFKSTLLTVEWPDGSRQQVAATQVVGDLFAVLRVKPELGSVPSAGNQAMVFVSPGLWHQHLTDRPDVRNIHLRTNLGLLEVAGVMPAGFDFPSEARVWVFLPLDRLRPDRSVREWTVISRLRDGVTTTNANTLLAGLSSQLASAYPQSNKGIFASCEPYRDYIMPRDFTKSVQLTALISIVVLVSMWLALSSFFSIFLVRQQQGLRTLICLGATKWRAVSPFAAVAALACVASLFVSEGVYSLETSALASVIGEVLSRAQALGVQHVALIWLPLATAILWGTAGVFAWIIIDPIGPRMKSGARKSVVRFGTLVTGAQAAVTLVLMVSSWLMVITFLEMSRTDLGFSRESRLLVNITLAIDEDIVGRRTRVHALLERIADTHGVVNVAGADFVPLKSSGATYTVTPEGSRRRHSVRLLEITPRYFETLNQRIVYGRDFTAADESGSPTLILNEAAAKQLFPDDRPLGKMVTLGSKAFEVIAVVADIRRLGPRATALPEAYIDYLRLIDSPMTAIIQTRGRQAPRGQDIVSLINSAGQGLKATTATTIDDLMAATTRQERYLLTVVGGFASLSTVVALAGIYLLSAYVIATRRVELAVRAAIGASPWRITMLGMRSACVASVCGLVVGILIASVYCRLLATFVYGVSVSSPVAYGLSSLMVSGIAVCASYWPSRKAALSTSYVMLKS